jgi:hypothetical protein
MDRLTIDRPTLEEGNVPTSVKMSSMARAECCTACMLPLRTVSLVQFY